MYFSIEEYKYGNGFSLGHIFLTILFAGSPPHACTTTSFPFFDKDLIIGSITYFTFFYNKYLSLKKVLGRTKYTINNVTKSNK